MVKFSDFKAKDYIPFVLFLAACYLLVGGYNVGRGSAKQAYETIERLEAELTREQETNSVLTRINSELTDTIERGAELTRATSNSLGRAGEGIDAALRIVDELEDYLRGMGEILLGN